MAYTCGFCNKAYDKSTEYANCVARCSARVREMEREALASRKEEAHKKRLARMSELRKELEKLQAEEYAEYPDTRHSAIKKEADLILSLLNDPSKFFR